MISVQEEQKGLPGRDRGVWAEARRILGDLPVGPQVALVRCEAGRSYSRERASIKILRDLELIQPNAWRPTQLGRCVVELMCR